MNKNKVQAPVAQTLDSAIQRIINNYAFHLIEIYRVDMGLLSFEQQEPGRQDAQNRKMCLSAFFFCSIIATISIVETCDLFFFLLSSFQRESNPRPVGRGFDSRWGLGFFSEHFLVVLNIYF